jgi:hypothetical protein
MNNCTGATDGDGSEEGEDANSDADVRHRHSGEDGEEEVGSGRVGRENTSESSVDAFLNTDASYPLRYTTCHIESIIVECQVKGGLIIAILNVDTCTRPE